MDLIGLGELLIDFIPGSEPYSYIRKAGGAPMNSTIAVARNGLDTAFYGKVGDDAFGEFLMDTLKENNVEPLCKEPTKEAVTTMAIVTLYEDGERTFTFVRKPGADMFLYKEDITEEVMSQTKFLHVAGSLSFGGGPIAETAGYTMKMAHDLGKVVSFDINYRDFIWDGDEAAAMVKYKEVLPYVDLLKISEEEAELLGGEDNLFNVMKEYGIATIIETLGSKGARCYYNGETREVAGRKAEAVDATGAGDAFWGGFMASLLLQGVVTRDDLSMDILEKAMNYGNIAGWFCVQRKGAIDALPTREQVESYL
ncbi:MAG: carbohydrate kinase [Lachnospiraceae bacterium]|nr:carbohydrate kinase [Lachnospiraceae bacterium]